MADEAVRTGVDTAGGGTIGSSPLQTVLRDSGQPVGVFGDAVANHGSGSHANATMVGSNSVLRAAALLCCRAGDNATCLHQATGSGVLRLPDP